MSAESAAPCFVDTNILVYAVARDDEARSSAAQRLLIPLAQARTLRTSTQVLQELFVTLTRKIGAPFTPEGALRYVDGIARWPVVALDWRAVREAIQLSARASLSLWDALIVVAAARSGAKVLYTEDLQHGQKILGVEVVNPFLRGA
jgi:predicted nucleic acid-binding protein